MTNADVVDISVAGRVDPFTPFLGELRRSAEAAIRTLLGLPEATPLDLSMRAPTKDGAWTIADCNLVNTGAERLGFVLTSGPIGPDGLLSSPTLSVKAKWPPDDRRARFEAEFGGLLDSLKRRLHAIASRSAGAISDVADRLAALAPYFEIDDYMYRQISRSHTGVNGQLRLGFRCNQNCYFCWQGRDWPQPPPELFFTWLREMSAAGVSYLSITGGEPTLFRELPELIGEANGLGMTVDLQTNAIRLAKSTFVEKLVSSGLTRAFVSLHAADSAVSDAMTRAPRTYMRTVEGVRNALGAGLSVTLNCVVEQANYRDLPTYAQFIVDELVSPFADNPVEMVVFSHPHTYYDRDHWTDSMASLGLIRPPLLEAIGVLRAAGLRIEAGGTCGFPPCLYPEHPDLMLCFPLEEVGEKDIEGRAFADSCSECLLRPGCLGVRREYLERFGGEGLEPLRHTSQIPTRWKVWLESRESGP